ncbi:hypothetical protein [Nitratireductor aquibiodomus]|uniref:hypothetical protein n=1 Tax=Nitratireductor aquibiodomus TaxID=204799 RepID=UPI0012FD00C0|nr:hypothetical protein [Nitratireductor aquibiodomus]
MADIFSEWLRTNRVDDAFLRRNLSDDAIPVFLTGAGASGRSVPPETSGEAAWEMAAQALTAGIPELSRLIRFVQTRVPRSFEVQQAGMAVPSRTTGAPEAPAGERHCPL